MRLDHLLSKESTSVHGSRQSRLDRRLFDGPVDLLSSGACVAEGRGDRIIDSKDTDHLVDALVIQSDPNPKAWSLLPPDGDGRSVVLSSVLRERSSAVSALPIGYPEASSTFTHPAFRGWVLSCLLRTA